MNEDEEKNNVIYKDVDTKKFDISYYPYYVFNYIHSNIRSLNMFENRFEASEIINGLYVGAIDSSYDKEELIRLGITHIISVIPGHIPPYPNDFKYMIINAMDDDNTKLYTVFEDSNKFIDDAFENKGNVLIHCLMGRSRSSTIASAYLIHAFGMNVHEILSLMVDKRNIIQPNTYFMKQLNKYYNKKYHEHDIL
jgi:protein-tyrosine phosphatase